MAILGPDDRVQITPVATGSYRAVVEIEVVWPDGTSSRGSGAMIGRNDVLTAGHAVYSAQHGGYAKDIYVFPGRDGLGTPYGFAMGTAAKTTPEWEAFGGFGNELAFANDVGVITLDRNVGDLVGWYNYRSGGSAGQYTGAQVVSVGYPGDKPYATQWSVAGQVDESTGTALNFTSGLDIFNGQSGSPVFAAGSTTILAVVSNESNDGKRNQAVRISDSFAATIAAFTAGDAPENYWPISTGDAGNTRATAKQIYLPLGANGVVGQSSDPADWFRFDATTDGLVTLSLRKLGNPLAFRIIDENGATIASADSNGIGDRNLSFAALGGHSYYVVIDATGRPLSGYLVDGKLEPQAATRLVRANTLLDGTAGNDLVIVEAGSSVVHAGGGNDRIEVRTFGVSGVVVEGQEGRDLVSLPGFAANFLVAKGATPGSVQITPFSNAAGVPEGKDLTVIGVEYVQFSDKLLFTLTQGEADVARLYTAALGRTPDIGGLDMQVAAQQAGTSLHQLAANFAASTEYAARFGFGSDADFIDRMYLNSLGRASDAGGKAFWLDYLAHGHDRADVLVGFATSPEHAARTGDWLFVV